MERDENGRFKLVGVSDVGEAKVCEECGREFIVKWRTTKNNLNRVCSKKCRDRKVSRVQRRIALTNNPMWKPGAIAKMVASQNYPLGKAHPNWKGGRTRMPSGYIEIKAGAPQQFHKGYKLEHRLVMEQALGRELSSSELVHHVNGDVTDNRVENLQLTTRAEHASFHHKGLPKPKRT